MPYGLPFLYDDEERKRLLTPPINPDAALPRRPLSAPPLPETPRTMPGLPPPSPLPEVAAPNVSLPARGKPNALPGPPNEMEPFEPPSRYTQVQAEKEGYLRGTPGRGKSSLKGALRGFVRGLGTGQGLGGGIGGAITGAAQGAIDPRGLREAEFQERELPKLYERFAFEDADRAAKAAARKAAGEQALNRMQLANTQSQINSRTLGDELAAAKEQREADAPLVLNPGQVAIERRTGREVFKSPALPKAPTDADIEQRFFDETGDTIESLSQKSLAGRIETLKGRLTPEEQRFNFGVVTDSDNPQAVSRAQAKWAKIQDDELNSIRRDTAARVRAQYRGSQGAQSGPRTKAKPIQREGRPGRRIISIAEAADLLK